MAGFKVQESCTVNASRSLKYCSKYKVLEEILHYYGGQGRSYLAAGSTVQVS